LPSAALAQGSGSAPPAGGGEAGQIVIGTIVMALLTAGVLGLVSSHRNGRTTALQRLADFSGRPVGLPGRAAPPPAIAGGSLIVAVLGMYWDISIHLDQGRDAGPFANAAHYLILAGLFGITVAGLFAMALPKNKATPTSVELPILHWMAPLG